MEPQLWEPCNYQLPDWSMEHAVWIPGVPVLCESESTEMACLEETFVASSSRGQQLVQYAAAARPKYEDPLGVFRRKSRELQGDNDRWRKKMHRYPASIREVGVRYTVPTVVSIGPYHHGRDHLKKAEEAKHVAACSCIELSGLSVQEIYDAVVAVADEARSLYDKKSMAGMEDDDFWPMMFYDACFLVQFMLSKTNKEVPMHPWLHYFFKSNKDDIYHDILLLENQLPCVVLETFERFTPVNLKRFAKGFKATLQNSRVVSRPPKDLEVKTSVIHDSTSAPYKPPHLLGYVRFYIVGTNRSEMYEPQKKANVVSFSVSAIELEEMGITLTPSDTTELANMGFKERRISAELILPHILLTHINASFLVNMAAFEITSKPRSDHGEETAVCSYVQLLGMLMDKEEDVQELRSKRLLQGGGGLTNKEALNFFTSLQGVTVGPFYHRTIRDVEMYKQNRRMWVKVYAFCYKYKKTVLAVLSVIVTLSGILGKFTKK